MDGIKEIKTVADLKAAFPDLTKQIEEAATDAERKRIQDIEDVAIAGYETIVADAKFKTPIAAGDVAKAILAEQKKQGGKYIQDRDDDAHASGAGPTLEPEDSEREPGRRRPPMKWTRPLTSCSPT